MRVLMFASVVLTLVAAFALYRSSFATRQLELRVQAAERAVGKARADIAILRAERAYLSRPERIEPLARRLGLEPMSVGQYVRVEDLSLAAAKSAGHSALRDP